MASTGKLGLQPQRLGAAPVRMEQAGSVTVQRYQATPWRAWYGLARWSRMRDQVLREAAYTCAMCGKLQGDTSQLVADHINPHRGDAATFWDRRNVQCLCKPCHDGAKQRQDRRQGYGI